ncbi:MAG: undecaprenyl-diphosphate phosphatase [Lachnospiraceae bacterium]|jgi:undecaprenyl-diphosphatase|nr:undecaprenyl-diphosphate phosphatase [Lachnospiraceae bacterium]
MTWIQGLIYGAVQGLTEFLPVSSSGHLVIFYTFFGESEESNLAFSVFLHLATLTSVIVVFHKDIRSLLREFFTALIDICKGKISFATEERRFLLMVIIGSVPAGLAGVLVKISGLSAVLENIFVTASMLLVTAALMFAIDKIKPGEQTAIDTPLLRTSLIVGLVQAIAILPGISRSGSTIFGGLMGGLKRDFAVKYAFILSIPVILGAGMVELIGLRKSSGYEIELLSWTMGFLAAAICGILAIRLIKLLIKSNRFYFFGIYCLLVAIFGFLVGLGIVG